MDNFRQVRRSYGSGQSIEGIGRRPVVARGVAISRQPSRSLHVTPRPCANDGIAPVMPVAPQPLQSSATPLHKAPSPQGIMKSSAPKKIQISVALPGAPAEAYRKHPLIWRKKWSAFRVWSLRTTAVAMALVIGLGAYLFAQGYLNLHKAFQGGASAAAMQTNVNPALLKGEGDGRVNVLLLGVGGEGHDGPDLTDTIMIASVDPVNHKASLLSIPRDLWVNIPNHGQMKLNAAYETGKYQYLGHEDASDANHKAVQAGFTLADQTIEDITGIPIHYNVLVNFQAFQKAVDTVGGVTINVPTELYDPTMEWENGWNPVLAKPGIQHFDGKKALLYVRSRETSSDFARGERQRAVILALKQKVVTLGTLSNPLKISDLMGAFGDNVVTDFGLSDAARMYTITKDISDSSITSLGLTDGPDNLITTAMLNGQSIVEPRAGMYDYSAIQAYVRSHLPDGFIVKEHARVAVFNGTTNPGLASKEAALLKSYGYTVISVGNAPTTAYVQTSVVDLTGGKDKYTKHYLEQRFKTIATTKLPDQALKAGSADFVIILGNDETASSQN